MQGTLGPGSSAIKPVAFCRWARVVTIRLILTRIKDVPDSRLTSEIAKTHEDLRDNYSPLVQLCRVYNPLTDPILEFGLSMLISSL